MIRKEMVPTHTVIQQLRVYKWSHRACSSDGYKGHASSFDIVGESAHAASKTSTL